MFGTIRQFFDTRLAPAIAQTPDERQHALRLAVAALLVEVAESDYQQHPDEQATLLTAVSDHFGLTQSEADGLIALAIAEHTDSTDYYQFTRLINDHYDQMQKIAMIEMLWRVAFADGQLHKYEEHVIRRLAGLLHVPHREFIASRHRVLESR